MGQPRRSFKRRAVEGRPSRDKTVLVDLNAYPDEVSPSESMFSVESTQAVILGTQRDAPAQMPTEPIDVDALEDDVVFISSRRVPIQAARRVPVVIDITDEDSDTNQSSSVAAVEALISISSNRHGRSKQNPCDRNDINSFAKKKRKSLSPLPECASRPVVAPKQDHVISCAVCLGRLVNETSTICGHIFCEACIKNAIKHQNKCPSCRKSLTLKKIHRIYLS